MNQGMGREATSTNYIFSGFISKFSITQNSRGKDYRSMGSSIHIFLLSSALRISVEKNLIISTKLLAGMPAKLISSRKLNSKEESKLTLVDSMDIVRQ